MPVLPPAENFDKPVSERDMRRARWRLQNGEEWKAGDASAVPVWAGRSYRSPLAEVHQPAHVLQVVGVLPHLLVTMVLPNISRS